MNLVQKYRLHISVLGAAIIWMLLIILALLFEKGTPANIFLQGLGGSPGGIIQFVCYGVFIYSILHLNHKERRLKIENQAFDERFLPEREHLVLSPDQVKGIKLEIIEREKEGISESIIPNLIKKVCNQYRNNHSVVEAYQILETQVKSTKEVEEANLEFTRYILQALQMLGLIGTVIGLTQAIGKSGGMLQIDPLAKELSLLAIIDDFSLAFGTTLVAITLGLFLAFRYHTFLARMDSFFSKAETYIIDNLISRIYDRPR